MILKRNIRMNIRDINGTVRVQDRPIVSLSKLFVRGRVKTDQLVPSFLSFILIGIHLNL